jgi:hypothetical protein
MVTERWAQTVMEMFQRGQGLQRSVLAFAAVTGLLIPWPCGSLTVPVQLL